MVSEDPIAAKILEDLKGTPYACNSLIQLSGGSANFTYRGTLITPLLGQTSTIIIKHAEPYVAISKSWELDVIRSHYEQTMLTALHTLRPTHRSNIHVTTPHLFQYSSTTDTQVLSDYPSSLELKNYITTYPVSASQATRLGVALGSWLKDFHSWGRAPEQDQLRETMKGNQLMVALKFMINYGRTEATIELFPKTLEGSRTLFKEIEEKYKREVESMEDLIHGDFWTGNILIHDSPIPSEYEPVKLMVIDWEISQVGPRAFDLGQCFAELYLLTHFRSIQAGVQVISAFMVGYGRVDDNMAFRIALHFGVHLIVWPCRVPGWGEGEIMEKCVEFGRDCCKHAWEKDKEWFKGGVLDKVFFLASGITKRED